MAESGISFEIDASVEKALQKIEGLTGNIDKISDIAKKAGKIIEAALNEAIPSQSFKASLDTIAESIEKAEDEAQELKKSMQGMAEGAELSKANQRYDELNEQLSDARALYMAVAEASEEYNRQIDSEDKTPTARQRLREMTAELADLTLQYRSMSQAEQQSASGQALEKKIEQLTKEAGDLRDAMDDATQSIKNTASDTATFDALTGGLTTVSATAELATGAMTMLGASEEDVQQVQADLQATMAVTNGLTTIQTNLQKQSALMLGITAVQSTAAAKAEAYRRLVTMQGTSATIAATVAQKAFNLVAKVNPYVLLATAVVTVIGALALFAKGTKEATEAEKAQQAALKAQQKAYTEYQNALATSTGKTEAAFKVLQMQWKKLNTTAEKIAWIKDNATAMNQLGLSVRSVNDADVAFIKQSKDVIAALKARAEANALQALYQEEYVKAYKKNKAADKSVAGGGFYHKVSDSHPITQEERKAIGQKAVVTQSTTSSGIVISDVHYEDTKEVIDKINAYREEKARNTNRKIHRQNSEMLGQISGDMENATERAAKLEKGLSVVNNGDSGIDTKTDKTPKTKTDDRVKEVEQANKEYVDAIKKAQDEANQAEIDKMQEGKEKTLAQIDKDYEDRIKAINEAEQKAAEAKKKAGLGDLTDTEKGYYSTQRDTATSQHENSVKKENDAEKEIQRAYLEQYGSYEQQKLAITQKYDKLIAEANNEWQKKAYRQQQDSEINNLDFSQLQKQLNWQGVFGNLTDKTKAELTQLKAAVQKAIDSHKYDKDIKNLQTLYERITAIDEQLITKNGAFNGLGQALDELAEAKNSLTTAEEKLSAARAIGDAAAIKAAESEVELANKRVESSKETVSIAKKNTAEFISSFQSLFDSIGNAVSGGSWSGIFSGIEKIAPTFDSVFGSNLSGVFDELGDEMVQQIDNMVSQTANIIQTLSNSGVSEQELSNAYLESIVGQMDDIISGIDDSNKTIAESVATYQNAKETAETTEETVKAQVESALGEHKTNWHSTNVYANDKGNIDWSAVNKYINTQFGKNVNIADVGGLYTKETGLTLKQIQQVLTQFPNITASIQAATTFLRNDADKDTGAYRRGNAEADDVETALKAAEEATGKLEEAEELLQFAMTNISLDSIESEFSDTLIDMTNDADDFGDNMEKILREAVVNGMMKDTYNAALKKWYEQLSTAMSSDGLDADEVALLKSQYQQIVEQATNQRDQLYEVLGLDDTSTVSASQKSVASMSEDTASELNGRFTALQIAGDNIDTNIKEMLTLTTGFGEKLDTINLSILACNGTLDSILAEQANVCTKLVTAIGSVQSAINNRM